ncbi:MAG: hypothetical protein ABI183_15740, partial [Polyangiaceae bacterium]
ELYFVATDGASYDIAKGNLLSDGGFTDDLVTELNSDATDSDPVPSADGLQIFFSSNRLPDGGTGGDGDIWMATRSTLASTFGVPVRVAELSTSDDESPTWLASDGCIIYINRATGGEQHIYRATRPN